MDWLIYGFRVRKASGSTQKPFPSAYVGVEEAGRLVVHPLWPLPSARSDPCFSYKNGLVGIPPRLPEACLPEER